MNAPHNFPTWLLTPLLLINLGIFTLQLGFTWFMRQKSLVYSTFLLLAVVATFIAGAEKAFLGSRVEALPPPPQFENVVTTRLVNRTYATSVYLALRAFSQANPPATQLSLITARLAAWLDKPADAALLQNATKLADPFVNCYSVSSSENYFSLKCENSD